jgi:flagellar motor switch protein FliN
MTTSTDKKNHAGHGTAEAAVGGRGSAPPTAAGNMEFILDIPLEVTIELGRTKLLVHELLKLGQGSVIELSKLAGETLEVLANQKLVARGEAVVINEKYGVRLTEVVSPMERIERLR